MRTFPIRFAMNSSARAALSPRTFFGSGPIRTTSPVRQAATSASSVRTESSAPVFIQWRKSHEPADTEAICESIRKGTPLAGLLAGAVAISGCDHDRSEPDGKTDTPTACTTNCVEEVDEPPTMGEIIAGDRPRAILASRDVLMRRRKMF